MSRRPAWERRPVAPPVQVVPAAASDLIFIVGLQKAYHRALGFLPRLALAEKIRRRQVLVARVAGRRTGFLHHGSLARPEVRVFQLAVSPDAQGAGVGSALVGALVESARRAGAQGLSLRCLAFLDANRFWRAVGFTLHAVEPGAQGALNVWVRRVMPDVKPASQGGRFTFASRVHACPACGAPTVDTWVRGARRLSLCGDCVAAAGLN